MGVILCLVRDDDGKLFPALLSERDREGMTAEIVESQEPSCDDERDLWNALYAMGKAAAFARGMDPLLEKVQEWGVRQEAGEFPDPDADGDARS